MTRRVPTARATNERGPPALLGALIRVNHGLVRRALVVVLVLLEMAAVVGLIIAGVRPV